MLKNNNFIGLDESRIEEVIQAGNIALEPLGGSSYPMIDTHVHAVNFLQETPGFANLIAHMDRSNIQKAVVF